MGSYYPNAFWLVVCKPNGHYFFHNNYNYIAIKNGKIIIIPSTINDKPPNESEFRIQDVLGSAQAVYIESVHMPGYFINFDEEGQPYEDNKLKTKERPAQFEIQLVSLSLEFFVFFNKIANSKIMIIIYFTFRLLMDLVFNRKKMINQLKNLKKMHLHHIGQLHQIIHLKLNQNHNSYQ